MADIFRFESSGLGPDVFRVLRFTGTEAVSECYNFDLELLSLKEFDIQSLYDSDATFTVSRQDGSSTTYRGRVATIEVEKMMSGGYFRCRAQLVPHLWFYTLRKSSKVYVGKTITDIINTELKENGEGVSSGFMPIFDQLPATVFPLVVKYHETPLEFISRLLQRECLYYYFMAEKGMDMLKFSSDAKLASNETLTAKVINNLTFSSLGVQDERILFKSARMGQAMRAESLNLYTHDGNPDSVETLHGIGRTSIKKDMLSPFRNISNIRQSQDSRPAVRYNMATSVRGVRVGIVHDGLRALSLEHAGDQSAAVMESLGLPTDSGQKDFYRNQGLWMSQAESYIPEWKLGTPRIAHATLTGFTTRINTDGTYDVKCHSIDPLTDLPNVRMGFPFVGKKGETSGMHLPLVDGSEVLLEFLEGDPDRPVIMGSLYNSSVISPVTAINKTNHVICTPQVNRICLVDGGENKITIEAQQRIEAFSQSELLEIDSDQNIIKGHSTNLVAFHAAAPKGGEGTDIVLDGSGKHVHMQAWDGVHIDLDHGAEHIVADANGTKVDITNAGQDNIVLTTNGGAIAEVSGSGDFISFVTAEGTSVRIDGSGGDKVTVTTVGGLTATIDGRGDKVEMLTSGGAKGLIDGGGDKVQFITAGNANLLLEGGNVTLKDSDGQSIVMSGGTLMSQFKKAIKNIFEPSFTINGASEQKVTGGYTNELFLGERGDFMAGINATMVAGLSLEIEAGLHRTLGPGFKEITTAKERLARAQRECALGRNIDALTSSSLSKTEKITAMEAIVNAVQIRMN